MGTIEKICGIFSEDIIELAQEFSHQKFSENYKQETAYELLSSNICLVQKAIKKVIGKDNYLYFIDDLNNDEVFDFGSAIVAHLEYKLPFD